MWFSRLWYFDDVVCDAICACLMLVGVAYDNIVNDDISGCGLLWVWFRLKV